MEKKPRSYGGRKAQLSGICPNCGAHPPAVPGGILCNDCLVRSRAKFNRYYKTIESYRKNHVDRVKALYYERKAAGLCVKCGGEIEEKIYTTCEKCRSKNRKKAGVAV